MPNDPNDRAALRKALVDALGPDRVLVGDDDLAYYGTDRCRGGWSVAPAAIVLPRTVDEVQAVVRLCSERGAPLIPSGGRTGLTGAATATAGEVVLSLEKMNRVLSVDPVGMTLHCEAGATVEAVQQAAAAEGMLYPVDFAAKGTAQIGGSIATNAGGVRVVKYGSTRAWVMGLDVVLPTGERVELGGPLVKDNTGYDLRQLFIGAEGTLGVVVGATMRLCRPPAGTVVALCAVPDDAAIVKLFARVRRDAPDLSAFECFDHGCVAHVLHHRGQEGAGPFQEPSPRNVLIELEYEEGAEESRTERLTEILGDAVEAGEVDDAVLAATPAQGRDLWALREDISESLHGFTPHKADIALPVAKVAEFLAAWRPLMDKKLPGMEAVVFGHVGDGNLHLNVLRPKEMGLAAFLDACHAADPDVYGLVRDHGGSVSAEHGIGLLKRDYLGFTRDPQEVGLMRAIKQAFDPKGLMNPGKIFDLEG